MTIVMPEGTPTLGAVKVKAVVSITDTAAPKLATEINAVTSVDVSCHLLSDGWMPSAETAKQTKKRRLCSKRDTEQIGVTSYRVSALKYVHNPQTADATAGNEARQALKEGLKLHFLERQGKDAQTAPFAVGDRTRDHYLVLGPQIEMDDPDENGEFYIMQEVAYVTADGPKSGIVAA
jgi:hypothetical protein